METVFSLSFFLVAPFWLLMILTPHWLWTRRIIQSPLVVVPAAALYLVLVLPQFSTVFLEVLNPALPGIAALLGTEAGATIGWVHFLAFDVFVGRWEYLDSQERGISPWFMAPVLFLTLMLGPIGLLFYLGLRALYRERWGATAAS